MIKWQGEALEEGCVEAEGGDALHTHPPRDELANNPQRITSHERDPRTRNCISQQYPTEHHITQLGVPRIRRMRI